VRALLSRAGLFLLVFAVLQVGFELSRGSALEHTVIHDGTMRPAAALIRMLTPEIPAQAMMFSVKATGGGINIRNGCEGTEALVLLLAAFLVAPIAWRARLAGMALGVVAVFILNQLRVLALFYAWLAIAARRIAAAT
jgi:hypothetical protein